MAAPKVHLFLLAGQSNMAGRGIITPDRSEPIPGVMALQRDGSWGPAIDPIHWVKPIVGVGMARSFARDYLRDHPGVTIGFIPAACGGSPVEAWAPGTYFEATGSFPYNVALARVRAVRYRGELKGILWHQGESNSHPGRVENYEVRLTELFARFRRELDVPELPILIGQLGQFPGKPWTAERVQVDQIHRSMTFADPRIGLVWAEGLKAKADLVHFDAASLDAFGKRYARAWRELEASLARQESNSGLDTRPAA